MELLQLKYFLEVARHESITQAAASLHVSQPSLSQTIQRLEKELGVELFERSGRRISLTAKGQKYYDAVHNSLTALEEARTELTREGLQGQITIGSYMPITLLLPCIHAFADQHPDVTFLFLSIINSFSVVPENLDALLLYGHSNSLNFNERTHLGNVQAVMVVPSERTWEEYSSLGPEALAKESFVSLLQNGHYEEFFYNFFHEGRIPHIRYLTNSRSYKQELLEEGMGIGISNRILTKEFRDTGKYELLGKEELQELYDPEICIAWRGDKYLSPAARALKSFMSDWFRLTENDWRM